MLVDTASCGPPSILDSPTLARVERARLREEGRQSPGSYCSSERTDMQHAIKKGLLWQQRERLFSRWKERYFILTRDYLHCFKRSSGPDKISDMGQFIFKVKLVEVEKVEWINKKSYSTVGLTLQSSERRILLRAPVGLEDWFELLEECTMTSKERRRVLRELHNPLWAGEDPSPSLTWIINRGTMNKDSRLLSDSVPDLEGEMDGFMPRRVNGTPLEQRLSLLTDIDINSCSSQFDTPPPSVPATFRGRPCPYRHNNDVFFMSSGKADERMNSITPSYCSSRSALTPAGSFRSGHHLSPAKTSTTNAIQIKYRERSQSDVLNWRRTAELKNRRCSYMQDATHV